MKTSFPDFSPRVLLGSDNHQLISPLRNVLHQAGFHVDIASDYNQLEYLWQQTRHDIVLLEVSHARSIESAIESALRIKRTDAQQFIGYLADADLRMSGLTGDAVLLRDTNRLPEALRQAYVRKS